jgi:hypothetical protein
MQEWQTARDIISSFDDRLHDLRKYGFGFITALLAAEYLLVPSGSTSPALPNIIKLAVLLITLMLIVALHLMDRIYRILQSGAATRAIIVEKLLNLELTEVIGAKYRMGHVQRNVHYIYAAFTSGVLVWDWRLSPLTSSPS